MPANRSTSGRGYPLSALLLLVTASAVVMAVAAPILRGPRQAGLVELVAASIAGGVLLGGLGLLLGLFHYSRWRGVLWGGLLGGVLGLLLGPLIFVTPAGFPEVLLTAVGGALVIVGVAAVARLTSVSPESHRAAGDPFQETENGAAAGRRHPLTEDHDVERRAP